MNLKITYNWLLEYLETNATPYEIQKYLSLCGPTVDRVEKVGDDYLFEIEVTSNRVDAASVVGIARECRAILPQFGKTGELKFNPLSVYKFSSIKKSSVDTTHDLNLNVNVTDSHSCPRFTAAVLSDVAIKPSPDYIKKRLNICGIKSINNIVDISNYLMIEMGQPSHIFDFDKVLDKKMILRKSRRGEKIITLDGKTFLLNGGEIVIEDGSGQLIDLCGIMGAASSAVSAQTKRIVFFVQTYDGPTIRKTVMNLNQRTDAATYFEKGLDSEMVEATFTRGISLLTKIGEVKITSKIYDIYPKPYKSKTILVSKEKIDNLVGVELKENQIKNILSNLEFYVGRKEKLMAITVPSFRSDDIGSTEDIIEEVARIYGYHNLPSRIQKNDIVKRPAKMNQVFELEDRIRILLKHIGMNEVYNYSMISKKQMDDMGLDPRQHIKLSNPISGDLAYMRISLNPSLIKNITNNKGFAKNLYFFEIGKIYVRKKEDLPEEKRTLGVACNTDFFDLKGILETLFRDLGIEDITFKKSSINYMSSGIAADIISAKAEKIGFIGQIRESGNYAAELDLKKIVDLLPYQKKYQPANPYAVIKQDLTIIKTLPYGEILRIIKNKSKFLIKQEFLGSYGNKISLRLYFSSSEGNLTENEVKKEMEKIKKSVVSMEPESV